MGNEKPSDTLLSRGMMRALRRWGLRGAGGVVWIVAAAAGCAAEPAGEPVGGPPGPVVAATQPSELSRAARAVDTIDVFRTMAVLKEGRLWLAVAPPTGRAKLKISINGESLTDQGEVGPGDVVDIYFMGMVGTGANWFDILEVHPDRIIVRDNSTFYGIMPERHDLLSVRPYGEPRPLPPLDVER